MPYADERMILIEILRRLCVGELTGFSRLKMESDWKLFEKMNVLSK